MVANPAAEREWWPTLQNDGDHTVRVQIDLGPDDPPFVTILDDLLDTD
jgi:hypothetical protein